MSSLPNLGNAQPSASEVTLTPSARSASVAQIREEKLGGLARSLLSRSSRLLNKRKSSNKMRSMDMVSDGTEAQRSHIQEATRARSPKHARLASSGMFKQDDGAETSTNLYQDRDGSLASPSHIIFIILRILVPLRREHCKLLALGSL